MVVKAVWLDQVDDVEFVSLLGPCVRHPEVKPLGQMHCAAVVALQFKIVLKLRDLRCSVEIARFKAGLKKKSRFLGRL